MGYKNMMTTDVLNTAAFAYSSSQSDLNANDNDNENIIGKSPFSLPVSTVPTNATPDEIIAAVKGSMYRVSTWLLQIEKATARRREVLDSDLYEDQSMGTGYHGDFAPPSGDCYGVNEEDDDRDEEDDIHLPGYSDRDEEEERDDRDRDRDENSYDNEGEQMGERGEDDHNNNDSIQSSPPPMYRSTSRSRHPYLPSNRTDTYSTTSLLNKSKQQKSSISTTTFSSTSLSLDRVTVIFKAFVKAQNNKARWLGSNEKLTRLKFHGGMERVLRLKMNWQQFDAMWNNLDSKRSGDLDINEFRDRFGDLEDFNTLEGTYVCSIFLLIISFYIIRLSLSHSYYISSLNSSPLYYLYDYRYFC